MIRVAIFGRKNKEGNKCSTQWSLFTKDTNYFEPSKKGFIFNYRVENFVALLEEFKKEECDYHKFGWVLDNEGN